MKPFQHVRDFVRDIVRDVGDLSVVDRWRRGNYWQSIDDPSVLRALEKVDRSEFLPAGQQRSARRDAALPIGEGQTISQPYIVALMTQELRLRHGERVLEVGTGSGYQTALLCELTARNGVDVFSVERYESLNLRAAATLRSLGYAPQLRVGDGAHGWKEASPFQAIVLTSAPPALPRPIWEQLDEGGRLVAPIGPPHGSQTLWRIEKRDGAPHADVLAVVRFVPLVSPLFNNPAMCIEVNDRSNSEGRSGN